VGRRAIRSYKGACSRDWPREGVPVRLTNSTSLKQVPLTLEDAGERGEVQELRRGGVGGVPKVQYGQHGQAAVQQQLAHLLQAVVWAHLHAPGGHASGKPGGSGLGSPDRQGDTRPTQKTRSAGRTHKWCREIALGAPVAGSQVGGGAHKDQRASCRRVGGVLGARQAELLLLPGRDGVRLQLLLVQHCAAPVQLQGAQQPADAQGGAGLRAETGWLLGQQMRSGSAQNTTDRRNMQFLAFLAPAFVLPHNPPVPGGRCRRSQQAGGCLGPYLGDDGDKVGRAEHAHELLLVRSPTTEQLARPAEEARVIRNYTLTKCHGQGTGASWQRALASIHE